MQQDIGHAIPGPAALLTKQHNDADDLEGLADSWPRGILAMLQLRQIDGCFRTKSCYLSGLVVMFLLKMIPEPPSSLQSHTRHLSPHSTVEPLLGYTSTMAIQPPLLLPYTTLPLPQGWEALMTTEGRTFFVEYAVKFKE